MQPAKTNPITCKIVLQGLLEAVTPIHIGSGLAEKSEMDIIRDSNGEPYIPATSFLGVLRHAFSEPETNDEKISFNSFWGYTKDQDGLQSAISCKDLALLVKPNNQIVLRDGVCIDNATGIAKKSGKFDFELLEKGAVFQLDIEVTVRKQDQETGRYVRTLYELLNQGKVSIGAKTNNGLGKVRLQEDALKIFIFDFSTKEHVFNWLKQDFTSQPSCSVATLGKPFIINQNQCRITASMHLKNSLIVRSYTHEPEMPDSSQLQSGTSWVLPGSSIKGAIRARAERIVNTLKSPNGQEIIRDLFGYVDEDNTHSKKKGRLKVADIYFPREDFPAELQSRIRIDRFTGGVMDGALFDSMPIYALPESKPIEFSFEIAEHKPADIGLLLLLLKDLWTGDLAIGGEKSIGRGVFQGEEVKIKYGDQTITIGQDLSIMPEGAEKTLQGFIDPLHNNGKNK